MIFNDKVYKANLIAFFLNFYFLKELNVKFFFFYFCLKSKLSLLLKSIFMEDPFLFSEMDYKRIYISEIFKGRTEKEGRDIVVIYQ